MSDAPAHLSESARRAWLELDGDERLSRRLGRAGIEAAAVAMGRMRDAQARIDAEGLIVADPKGNPVPHPALAIERAASEALRKWI